MKKSKRLLIAVTGNIASGKSEVGEIFKNNGFYVIEADYIGWQVLEEKSIISTLTSVFGNIMKDGKIDRKRLGSIVFSDHKKLEVLNSIVHPHLLSKLKNTIESSDENNIAVIAALVFEWGIEDWFDKIILVLSNKRKRIERLLRNGLSREEANNRINSQIDDKKTEEKSNFIIQNNGTVSELTKKTLEIIKSLNQVSGFRC